MYVRMICYELYALLTESVLVASLVHVEETSEISKRAPEQRYMKNAKLEERYLESLLQ